MKKTIDLFFEMPCLTEQSIRLSGLDLQKKWFKYADKRYLSEYLQKFISYNNSLFNFLGIHPTIIGTDKNSSLIFRSAEYIGAIPLRAPDNGKQIGDFIVTPRFSSHNKFEDYVEILNLLEDNLNPEIIDSLPLISGNNFKPPFYLEAVKFIVLLEKLVRSHWQKFDIEEKKVSNPIGQINWNKYISQEYKIENRLMFPVRRNTLNQFHNDYFNLKYVYEICRNEIKSSNTPNKIRFHNISKLTFLDEKLSFHKSLPSNNISIRSSDAPIVKLCKEQANNILQRNLNKSTAWKIDYSNVFEKFIQYIFSEISKEMGGKLIPNPRFNSITRKHFSWELHHLEPDAIYIKGNLIGFIDAKYKSNLYNPFSSSVNLKDDHRRDIHQLLAYCSFTDKNPGIGFLCYPSNLLELKELVFSNQINNKKNIIVICGIPLNINAIDQTKQELSKKLRALEV